MYEIIFIYFENNFIVITDIIQFHIYKKQLGLL